MTLTIDPHGTTRLVYTEALPLEQLGALSISRHVSHVEPDERGHWWADLSPVAGPRLGPYRRRSQCVAAEVAWVEANVLDLF